MRYFFEHYEIDMQLYELRHNGQLIKLEPQEFNVLAYLIEQRHKIVTKEELLEQIWPDQFVSESVLSQRIMTIRKALGESGRAPRYLKTIHGRGYRFVTAVESLPPSRDEILSDPPPTDSSLTSSDLVRPLPPDDTAGEPPEQVITRKLMAVLSADVQGYSRLMEDDEAATVRTLTTYQECMTILIQQHNGRVVDMPGDNMLAGFDSVVDALQSAIAI